ncbi:MAG TPA: DUF2911 domain-containing protein [Thermoanaerobaculia bacterium]|jgi:hypothetical protein|nr:DUF2911 domain-containing protein [Thermoanaerobaculia bacterium]
MRKFIAICLFLIVSLPLAAQTPPPALKLPRVSQHMVATQTVGLTDITVDYSRPAVKGRAIWGALVPYDKVWRTGANEATQISFSDDVTIDGKALPKGTYSLHTIPGKDSWTLIFNKTAKQWGSFNYKQEDDALRVTAKPAKANFMELMTINFPNVTNDNATVVIRWENVSVPFTVGTNTTTKVMADANAAVAAAAATDFQTPLRAAGFAFDAGNSGQATKWVDQSLKVKQTMSNLYLKARIQAKNGDKAGAIASGESALKLAGPNDKELAGEIQSSINDWKK